MSKLVVRAATVLFIGLAAALCVRAGDDPPSPLDRALKELKGTETGPKKAQQHHGHRHAHADPDLTPPSAGMFQDFLDSWDLFHNTYLAGWLIAILLALLGVALVARNQIFFGLAVSEASTLGIALGLALTGAALGEDVLAAGSERILAVWAVGFAVIAALATSRIPRRETHEAVTGWVFLASASLSILVVMNSPHGMQEVQRLHASSLIGANAADVGWFAVLAAATSIALLFAGRRVLLVVLDPEMAVAIGLRVGWWNAVLLVWLGLAVGLSIRSAGTVYTFGCLVLPALIAKPLCREAWQLFVAAPAIALVTAALAFVLAHHFDAPPAQATVGVLAVLWGTVAAVTTLWGALRGRRAPAGPPLAA